MGIGRWSARRNWRGVRGAGGAYRRSSSGVLAITRSATRRSESRRRLLGERANGEVRLPAAKIFVLRSRCSSRGESVMGTCQIRYSCRVSSPIHAAVVWGSARVVREEGEVPSRADCARGRSHGWSGAPRWGGRRSRGAPAKFGCVVPRHHRQGGGGRQVRFIKGA